MTVQLILDGSEIDLGVDTRIALTMQINNIAEVADRQGNFSNTFKLPMTQGNRAVMEMCELIPSVTSKPYRKLSAKYIQSGLVLIRNGVAIVDSADEFYNVTVYS